MDSSNNNSYETNFALELFTNLLQSSETNSEASAEGNICISPFLLESLLSLIYLGSDGKTAEQLKTKLQLQRFPNNGKMANYFAGNLAIVTQESIDTQLEICSRILLNESFEVDAQFKKIAENYFLTLTERMKFENKEEVLKAIRNSLEKSLKKNDTNVSLKNNAKALLVLAANFKNKWFLPFSAYRSGLYDFHVSPDCIKSIPMMLDNEMMVKFVELKELDARVVELPYEHDDELAMLLILPNKRDGLKELETKLKDLNLQQLTEQMQMESVQLLLPKFKIDFECSLRQLLEKMGFNLMFSEESNFKNLLASTSSSTALPFSDIWHKASIEVNESGSEAAKVEATKPIVISNSIDTRQKFFRADHPFFFAIRNREATFFVGCVRQF